MQSISYTNWVYPKLVAHRGAGKLAPENTLASMRVGHSFGYRMFEFDVKLSADGKSVLLHDDTLNRTTSGNGRLSALTLSELSLLDAGSWHSAAYAGEQIPTLAAVARFLRANDSLANIEIKPTTGSEYATGAAVALDAQMLWAGADLPPLLSSFSTDTLCAAKEAAPELPRAHLFSKNDGPLANDWLDRCKAVDAVAIDIDHKMLTPEIIKAAHAANLRVIIYTLNDDEQAKKLLNAGVDVVITDAVDIIKPL